MSRIEDGGAVEAGLVELIRTAVRFYDQSAGAGLIIFGEPDPADYISEFLTDNPDAWDRLDSFVAEAVAAKDAEITRLRAENARMREVLTDIVEDRGVCSKCGRLAEMPSNCVSCDDDRRCTWSPRSPASAARAALSKASQEEGQTR